MSLEDYTDRPLDLQRAAVTPSPAGAPVRAFAAYLTAVPFAVAPASDMAVKMFSRPDAIVEYTLYTSADLPPGRVRIDDLAVDQVTGERFRVLAAKRYSNANVLGGTILTELHCSTLNN